MSIEIELDQNIKHTNRTTYDLLQMASNIGGIAVFLYRVFSLLVKKFATLRIDALITARLFYLS